MDLQTVRANKLDLVERVADDLAHEIKNPLHSMVINLEVLRRRIARLENPSSGDLMRYAGVLATELDRVTRRVDLLLRMTRPERGSEPITLSDLVAEILELLQMEAERRGVSIQFDPAATPLLTNVPRETARQLVLNLLLSTVDSARSGETLKVRTDHQGNWVRLVIQPPDGKFRDPREAGVSESNEPDGEQHGSLAVASALGSMLGGRVEMDSGETVVLSLPVQQTSS